MLITQSETLAVPVATGVVVLIRETNTLQRTFYLRNLGATELTLQIESSIDGGTTWSIVGAAFTLGAKGSGTDIAVKNVTAEAIVRIRGSGGANDRDLYLAYTRFVYDTGNVWTLPVM